MWEDGSIQWVHCDFAATVSANSQTAYELREVVALPEFPSPMGFIPRGKAFEVITGPLRFSIGGESNQLLDEVWVDEGWGYNFNEQTKILDSGNFDLLLTSGGRVFRTEHWTQSRIEVEEHNAMRATVKISGSFTLADSKERRLDYVARLTTYGGKTFFKLELTLLNRREAEFPIDELSLSFRLNLDLTQQKFILGGEPQDHTGNFENAPQATLSQDSAGLYSVSGAVQGSGSGRSARVGLGGSVGRRTRTVCSGEMVWTALSEGAAGAQRRNAGSEAFLLKPVSFKPCPHIRQDARDDASLPWQTAVGVRPGAECDGGISEAHLCRGATRLVLQSHAGTWPIAGILSWFETGV